MKMFKRLIVLYFAAGLFWVTRGNPLQRLLSQIPQNCNCPWNLQALLQTPQNGPYAPRIEAQNPTCPAQTCGVINKPSYDLNQLILPQNGPYPTYNEVQNPTCPAQTFGVPSLDLNQLIYDKILEHLGINRNCNQDISSGVNRNCNQDISSGVNRNCNQDINSRVNRNCNQDISSGVNRNCNQDINSRVNRNCNQDISSGVNRNCNQDINSGVNSNFNQNTNRQCAPQVPNNNNICRTSHTRSSDPKLGLNNEPQVVNNYIFVPPEVFQNQQSRNNKVCKEMRNRRQDNTESAEKRIDKNNQEIDKTNERSSNEKSKLKREPNNHDVDRTHDISDERSQSNKTRRRSRKRKDDSHGNSHSSIVGIRKENNETAIENVSYTPFKNPNELSQNDSTEFKNTFSGFDKTEEKSFPDLGNLDRTDTVTVDPKTISKTNVSESSPSILENNDTLNNDLKTDTENLTTNRSKTGNKRRSRKRKPKKDNNNKVEETSTRPMNNKEDALIKDFRKKFPNIPEDLIVKLIDFMKIKLQDDQSSISNAFNNYWNYPFNFEQFYQAQIANMMPNSEITVTPRNNSNNNRKRNRNRRRKSKPRKNCNDCNTVVELSTISEDENRKENEKNCTLVSDYKTMVNEVPITERKLDKSNIALNKTSYNSVKIDNLDDQTEHKSSQHVNSSLRNENEAIIETNKTNSDIIQLITDTKSDKTSENIEEQIKPSNTLDTIEKSVRKSETAGVVNKENNPNERIIKIKISVEPQGRAVTSTVNSTVTSMTLNNTDNSENSVEETVTSKLKSGENIEINIDESPIENHSASIEKIDKIDQVENQPNSDKKLVGNQANSASQDKNNVLNPKLEAENIQTVENEINDYFPNFETDNLAYLLQDLDELKHVNEGRYHYTTEIGLSQEDSSENYKHVYKENPEKLTIDLNPEISKTYSEIEDTIQKPEVEKLDKTEFITPPTLEVPDFETKPVKRDNSDYEHFVFFDHSDLKPQNGDLKSQNYVENKVSAYSEYKNKSTFDKNPKSEMKSYSNNIETVFAKSKVAKYGQKVYEDDDVPSAIAKTNHVNNSNETIDNNDKVTVVLAQSY